MRSDTYRLPSGIELGYRGDVSAKSPVLMLHGFGASHETWNDILPLLATTSPPLALDLLGFGDSAKPTNADYSPLAQAHLVNEFIDAHSLRDITLVGHSYGGGVALIAGLMSHFKSVRRLVLLDAAGYEQPLPFFVGALRVPLLNSLILNGLSARLRAKITLRHLFYDPRLVTPERIGRYAQYFDLPGARHAIIGAARSVIPSNHAEIVMAIPTINVPTLIIWGANDAAIDVRNAHRFHADIRNSQLAVLPHCGHIPHEERPADTANLLRRFIDRE